MVFLHIRITWKLFFTILMPESHPRDSHLMGLGYLGISDYNVPTKGSKNSNYKH